MRKLTVVLLMFSIYFAGFAQKDEKAKKILKEVSEKTKTYSTIKLKFLYIMDNRIEKVQDTTKGTIYIKGDMFKLFFKGTEVFSDGTTVWSYQPDSREITITEPDPTDENALNPKNLLRIYEKGFKYKFMGEFNKGGSFYQVDLYPENPKQVNYSIIKLKIDKVQKQLQSIKMVGKDGIDYLIELTQFKPNIKVVDSMFKYDAAKYPKDVEVNDMR
jgi:outer membrane lipoprotein-sorting protein